MNKINKDKDKMSVNQESVSCFVQGTEVLTLDGYKNIEDVTDKDELLTHVHKFQPIIELQTKIYSGRLYSFRITNHPMVITCTADKLFYVREKYVTIDGCNYGHPVWKKACDITTNDYFGMPINTLSVMDEFEFDDNSSIMLDDVDYWYILGYYLKDNFVKIDDKLKKIVDIDFDCLTKIEERIDKITNMNFNWNNLLKDFTNEKIPEWVFDAPKENIAEFLKGYSGYCGYCDFCGNCRSEIILDFTSHHLAMNLQRLYLKLGIVCSVTRNADKIIMRPGEYKNDFFMSDNYGWFKMIINCESYVSDTKVYNLKVANDDNYVIENIICHN